MASPVYAVKPLRGTLNFDIRMPYKGGHITTLNPCSDCHDYALTEAVTRYLVSQKLNLQNCGIHRFAYFGNSSGQCLEQLFCAPGQDRDLDH